MCPYNYLSPAAYFPCRARLALWGNYTTTLRYKCSRHREEEQSEPPMHDEANARRLRFLRCLVRVNNLPELCPPEQLVRPVRAAVDVVRPDARLRGDMQGIRLRRVPATSARGGGRGGAQLLGIRWPQAASRLGLPLSKLMNDLDFNFFFLFYFEGSTSDGFLVNGSMWNYEWVH